MRNVICRAGICFVLDLPEDDIASRLQKICTNIDCDVDERCYFCKNRLSACIVDDDSCGLLFQFDGSYKIVNFDNLQIYPRSRGCIIEYQLDCSELYLKGITPQHIVKNKPILIRLAKRVSLSLGFTDFTLIPFLRLGAWDSDNDGYMSLLW